MQKGKLWWCKTWFSICSKHQSYDPDCSLCNIGTWKNNYKLKISKIINRIIPGVWKWWMNSFYPKTDFESFKHEKKSD